MTESVDEHIKVATAALAAARRCLADEINGYPPPIAGCDAQFNHLLEQRRRVRAALAELTKASEDVHIRDR
ncbi:MAG: hypothetical protein ACFB6S_06745 [Geminicoccaceae bacterium]